MSKRVTPLVTAITTAASSLLRDRTVPAFGRAWLTLACGALVHCSTLPPISTGSAGTPSAPSPQTADYSRLERDVVAELNAVRTNPASYVSDLSQLLPLFSGNLLSRPGWPAPVVTAEGPAAVRGAITALRGQPMVSPLSVARGLAMAARDLTADQARSGNVGHTASDGSSPSDRISRYGTWSVSYSENVDYGQFTSGRDVVEDLIIDDGVPDRGHRRNVFDPTARVVGVSCGPHPRYGSVCVIDQAGGFVGL
jgi:uncharacterized protein YkwD